MDSEVIWWDVGLKQFPLLWNKHIHPTLPCAGFTRNESDFGLYFRYTSAGLALITLYVDDLLIAAPSSSVLSMIKNYLLSQYSIKDLGPVTKFFVMSITQSSKHITLDLENHIISSIYSLQIPTYKQVHTPIASIEPLFDLKSPPVSNITVYQSIIGQLLFAANAGRPGISSAVSILSRFLKDPRKVHLQAAKGVFKYLFTTRNYCLHYNIASPLSITVFSDAASAPLVGLP